MIGDIHLKMIYRVLYDHAGLIKRGRIPEPACLSYNDICFLMDEIDKKLGVPKCKIIERGSIKKNDFGYDDLKKKR